MDAASETICINGGHKAANRSSLACSTSNDTRSIDSNQSIEIKNGDYTYVKENVFQTPPIIHKKIITITNETPTSKLDGMDDIR